MKIMQPGAFCEFWLVKEAPMRASTNHTMYPFLLRPQLPIR
jgi:hypothetical protein